MTRHILTLSFKEDKRPYLQEVTDLLYYFEKLHDLSVVLADEEYEGFLFSHFFLFRKGSPIKPKHKLKAVRIVKESPLILEVAVASITGLSALIVAIERIRNWNLNKEKLELEVRKLRREEEREKLAAIQMHSRTLEQLIDERGASKVFESVITRLSDSPIVLQDIEIEAEPATKDEE